MNKTKGEVKRLYRDLSVKYHPDKNAEDTTEKFMRLKDAYEVLSDEYKRVTYDLHGQEDFSADDKMYD